MAERIHGYFNDDGTPVNPDLMPKPGLCATCRKDDQPDQEAACHLIRMEQQGEERFVCFAYESVSGPEVTRDILKEMEGVGRAEFFSEADVPDEKTSNAARRQRMLEGVGQFAQKLRRFSSVIEVGLAGTLASEDEYPNDIDAVVFLDGFNELPDIARAARQMASVCNSWEVFVFTVDFKYLGRICHYKECRPRVACADKRCGTYPHIYELADFVFDPNQFFSSPFHLFWSRKEKSLWVARRERLHITHVRQYARLQSVKRICEDCGKEFVFSVAEQKHFSKNGWRPPKRCERCRDRRNFGEDMEGWQL